MSLQGYRSYRRRVHLFKPTDIPGLKLWCQFNKGITISGAGVSQWDDQSGNGNHLKQGTDTNRPAKQSDGSILFDGVDNFIKADAFTFDNPYAIYLLLKQVTWTSGDLFFDGGVNNAFSVQQISITPKLRISDNAAGSAAVDGLALNTYGVVFSSQSGTDGVIQINSGSPVTATLNGNNMAGFALGARGGTPSGYSKIQVKEVVAFSAIPNEDEKWRMFNYMNMVDDDRLL